MQNKNHRVLLLLAITTILSGCSLAPDFQLPFASSAPSYKEELPETLPVDAGSWKVATPSANLERGEWWSIFNDATLNELETEASSGSQTVAAMAARVKQARALADAASASFFPSVDLNAGGTRERQSPAALGQSSSGPGNIRNFYDANLGLSYELDLFGRVLNTSRAADSTADSAAATLNSVKLALQADVAAIYFTLRAFDDETALLDRTLTLREDSLSILNKRLQVGTITELDTAQATVDLETTRSDLHAVRQQRKEAEHALAVLLGKAPAEFNLPPAPQAKEIPVVPAGIPSDVLERRPDIAAAQYDLAAANARIGIARAAFFPSLSLTATGGYQSTAMGDMFEWSSRAWAIGPLASLPIFRGGELIANNKVAKAAYEESVANYKQQVIVAFKDVEDSLSRLQTYSNQSKAQIAAEKAARRAQELAGLRYDSGDLGYLEDITAKQNALAVERQGISLQGSRLAETVRLIRALGGGWNVHEAATVPEVKPTPAPVPAATPTVIMPAEPAPASAIDTPVINETAVEKPAAIVKPVRGSLND